MWGSHGSQSPLVAENDRQAPDHFHKCIRSQAFSFPERPLRKPSWPRRAAAVIIGGMKHRLLRILRAFPSLRIFEASSLPRGRKLFINGKVIVIEASRKRLDRTWL